jgi:hypothetical protein
MKKATKNMIERWKNNVKKIKNTQRRRALLFMVEGIEHRINMHRKELGE